MMETNWSIFNAYKLKLNIGIDDCRSKCLNIVSKFPLKHSLALSVYLKNLVSIYTACCRFLQYACKL